MMASLRWEAVRDQIVVTKASRARESASFTGRPLERGAETLGTLRGPSLSEQKPPGTVN